jgi:acylphosphatase
MTTAVAHIVVEGRVQGVGFRAWVAREAASRGLAGWVRNRRTGAVEAVFEGPPDTVSAMVEACRTGPPAARVDALYTIDESDRSPAGTPRPFEVRDTI